jgi:hypothetical protein
MYINVIYDSENIASGINMLHAQDWAKIAKDNFNIPNKANLIPSTALIVKPL